MCHGRYEWYRGARGARSRFLLPISSRQNRGVDFYFEWLPAKIEETISILNVFPPKSRIRFLFWISSRQNRGPPPWPWTTTACTNTNTPFSLSREREVRQLILISSTSSLGSMSPKCGWKIWTKRQCQRFVSIGSGGICHRGEGGYRQGIDEFLPLKNSA